MSPRLNPFATVPISVDGQLCGYVTYVSGQHETTVVFDVQCLLESLTQKVLYKIFGEDCEPTPGYYGQSGSDSYYIARHRVTIKGENTLRSPTKYMKKIARLLVKNIQQTKIAEAETERARVHAQELLDAMKNKTVEK